LEGPLKVDPNLKIFLVWPRRDPSEPQFGFGAHRALPRRLIVVVLLATLAALWGIFGPASTRTAALVVLLACFAIEVAIILVGRELYRFYEVNDRAKPLRALSMSAPSEVEGRFPVRRARFLGQMNK